MYQHCQHHNIWGIKIPSSSSEKNKFPYQQAAANTTTNLQYDTVHDEVENLASWKHTSNI